MPQAKRFIFRPYNLDTDRSLLRCTYAIDFEEGERVEYTNVLEFPGATPDMWARIPPQLLQAMLESLVIMLGLYYWKIHCAPAMCIEGFSLTREQAQFWNTLYTKGLAEFFYRSRIDFRGLINFPYDTAGPTQVSSTPFVRSRRTLLTHGGGKDSIVSSEILKAAGIPFDLFVLNHNKMPKMQERVAELIGERVVVVRQSRDPLARRLSQLKKVQGGYPHSLAVTFVATLVAVLQDYRYVALSNEHSADIGNTEYYGVDVNHQWGKSTESEMLVREYIARFITPDVVPFSLLRQFSEIEMVRRFTQYPKYFYSFSSCNMNFSFPPSVTENGRAERAYWCNKCPKCVFIFACLAAFLPKETVIDIFGADLYADTQLLRTYRELLGLEGIKPFECVGTPEEMIVAMSRAQKTGAYKHEPAMDLFEGVVLPNGSSLGEIERRVFSAHGVGTIPEEFTSLLEAA